MGRSIQNHDWGNWHWKPESERPESEKPQLTSKTKCRRWITRPMPKSPTRAEEACRRLETWLVWYFLQTSSTDSVSLPMPRRRSQAHNSQCSSGDFCGSLLAARFLPTYLPVRCFSCKQQLLVFSRLPCR